MKKLLFASFFAAFACAMASCDNAVYDASPTINNSGAGNPLANGGVAAKGQMVATINGSTRVFSNAYYVANSGGIMMQGASVSDNINHAITMVISNYNGVGTYHMSGNDVEAKYTELNLAMNLTEYSTGSSSEPGYGDIVVTEDAGGEIKGTFYFNARNSGNVPNSVNVVSGTFDLPKQ